MNKKYIYVNDDLWKYILKKSVDGFYYIYYWDNTKKSWIKHQSTSNKSTVDWFKTKKYMKKCTFFDSEAELFALLL